MVTLKSLASQVRIATKYGASLEWDRQDDWQRSANGWRCTLHYKRRSYAFDFWQGVAVEGEPTADGCLECLLSDAQAGESDFRTFCADLGYDEDSRKAKRVWQACRRVNKAMRRLLGDDYETFLYADRN